VPFQINAHYYSGPVFIQRGDQFEQHYGETRDQRIAEYHEMNHLPVLGLWEGGLLIVEDGQATLLGAPARLFVRSKEPVDIEPGTVLPIGNLEEVTR